MSRPGPRQADCPTGSAHRSVGSPRLLGPGPCSDGSSRSSPLLPLWWVLWVLQATSPEPRALCVCDPGRLLKRRCCSGRRRRRAWYQLVFSGPETAQLDARRWPWGQRASAAQHLCFGDKAQPSFPYVHASHSLCILMCLQACCSLASVKNTASSLQRVAHVSLCSPKSPLMTGAVQYRTQVWMSYKNICRRLRESLLHPAQPCASMGHRKPGGTEPGGSDSHLARPSDSSWASWFSPFGRGQKISFKCKRLK